MATPHRIPLSSANLTSTTRRHDAERLRAARRALSLQNDFLDQRESFSLEIMLCGMTYLELVWRARKPACRVCLRFFSVASVEIFVEHVAKRVWRGGHDVPGSDTWCRYRRACQNFFLYADEVCDWMIRENSSSRAVSVAYGQRGCIREHPVPKRGSGPARYNQLQPDFRSALQFMKNSETDISM